MMFFMMRGMDHGGTDHEHDQPSGQADLHDHHDASGR